MFRRAFKIFSLMMLMIAAGSVLASQASISIDSQVDKSTIRIGDLVKYTITVTHSEDVTVQTPSLGANLGAFEIREYTPPKSEKRAGQIVEQITYTVSTFDTGAYEIPSLTFRYTIPGDTTEHVLQTEKLKIYVQSLKPSEAGDIRDIKAPLSLSPNYRQLILWGSVALGVALLLGALYYVYRSKKAGKGLLPKKEEPPRPPHAVALDELNALRASSLLPEGRIKEYYIQVSEIIRRYIEGRYFIMALELTTFELIEKLRTSGVETEIVQMIHNFLDDCDLVKFAKYQPAAKDNAEIIERAIEIVERTKLVYDQAASKPAEPGVAVNEASKAESVLADEVEVTK